MEREVVGDRVSKIVKEVKRGVLREYEEQEECFRVMKGVFNRVYRYRRERGEEEVIPEVR